MIIAAIAELLGVPADRLEECRAMICAMLKMLSGELREAGGSNPALSKKTSAQSAQPPPSFRNSRENRLWARSKRMDMASAGPSLGTPYSRTFWIITLIFARIETTRRCRRA